MFGSGNLLKWKRTSKSSDLSYLVCPSVLLSVYLTFEFINH